jgi:regulator of nonsense transcripts 1
MDALGYVDCLSTDQLASALSGSTSITTAVMGGTSGGAATTSYDMGRRRAAGGAAGGGGGSAARAPWSQSSMDSGSVALTGSSYTQSDASSAVDDNETDDGYDQADEEYGVDKEDLPEYACAYCGFHDTLSCAMCTTCNRWFCNGRDNTSGSHIVTHMVVAKHTSIKLHSDGPLGDGPLECFVCGARNIFSLGFIPSKEESVVVIICREPCLHSQTLRDMDWEASAWLPLIEEKRLLPWLCSVPASKDRQEQGVRHITNNDCREIENLWKVNANMTATDFMRGARAEDSTALTLPQIPFQFRDGNHYADVILQFINAECNTSREISESLSLTNMTIAWSIGLQRRKIATIQVPPEEGRISVGDEIILSQPGTEWEATGVIVRMESAVNMNNELSVEIKGSTADGTHQANGTGKQHYHGARDSGSSRSGGGSSGVKRAGGSGTTVLINSANVKQHVASALSDDEDESHVSNITLRCVFKAVNFDRQRAALRTFVRDDKSVAAALFHAILGQGDAAGVKASRLSEIKLPDNLTAPGIPRLNTSQTEAVRAALTRPLTLIQGPPGTGKTSTSATLVYQMCTLNDCQVLVCSPSNVAVDQLADRVEKTGLNVIRLYARSRESITSTIDHLALHNQVRQFALSSPQHSELHKLFLLKEDQGDLSDKDRKRFLALVKEAETDLLENCDVVCCTCSGAGDQRLSKFSFRHVLIDESTQATEAEVLIPIVMGASQLILVGDHCQMGPVILNKPAEEAGYNRSLFERLIQLGQRPYRLEVQYRMHPALSEFSSNAFYEGTLQNGVTAEDRDASRLFPWPNASKPTFFYNSIHPEEISASGTSFLNRTEAALAEKMATLLLRGGILPHSVGIITPYEGQRNFLVQYLNRQGPLGPEAYRHMEIASVDSFQGREKDFIILTCVRSNDQQGIGFLNDWRRLNVALTRARRGVMIIGNARVLSRHALWHDLLTHFQKNGLIVEGPVMQLTPAKVALQKVRLTAQAVGPRSTQCLTSMYQGTIGMMMEGPGGFGGAGVPGYGGGPQHPPAGASFGGYGGSAAAGAYQRSYRGGGGYDESDNGSIASSEALQAYFDLSSYCPGEAPAHRAQHHHTAAGAGINSLSSQYQSYSGFGYGAPASQDSRTGWSTPSQQSY